MCNAIDYAHTRGVLHRDIKPGNIIVGKHGETLVVDWGLAKATGKGEPGAEERTLVPNSASGSAETLPGMRLGTPAYMSPEQARGDLASLGPRSDVYSLGATLYCLLTGRPPFDGEVFDVLRKVQGGEFAPPRRVDPSVDAALEVVCLKAMAAEPGGRYPTPKALAEDVERWMADELNRVQGAQPVRRRLLQQAAEYFARVSSERTGDRFLDYEALRATYRAGRIQRALGEIDAAIVQFRDAARRGEDLLRIAPENVDYLSLLASTEIETGVCMLRRGARTKAKRRTGERSSVWTRRSRESQTTPRCSTTWRALTTTLASSCWDSLSEPSPNTAVPSSSGDA